MMTQTLKWRIKGEEFEDGSKLAGWTRIESSPWHWQYDDHELAFGIYAHGSEYWKLYHARWLPSGATDYAYGYGGQACRVTQVEYTRRARSPHSGRLMQAGALEWVRTAEVDRDMHRTVKAGRAASTDAPETGQGS